MGRAAGWAGACAKAVARLAGACLPDADQWSSIALGHGGMVEPEPAPAEAPERAPTGDLRPDEAAEGPRS